MTSLSPHYRALLYYSIGMGLYGATRGYRSTSHYNHYEKKWEKTHSLIGHRLINTMANGVFYMYPPCGMIGMIHLMNRIQIRQMGWNSEEFPKEYEEYPFGTYCLDTL